MVWWQNYAAQTGVTVVRDKILDDLDAWDSMGVDWVAADDNVVVESMVVAHVVELVDTGCWVGAVVESAWTLFRTLADNCNPLASVLLPAYFPVSRR